MSVFHRALGYIRTKLSIDTSEGWYPGRPATSRPITSGAALSLSTVWACTTLIGGTISTLSLELYEPKNKGVVTPAVDHPLYSVLNSDPNFDLTSCEFWEYMSAAIELHGNGYALKRRGVGDNVVSLDPINPEFCKVVRNKSGALRYSFTLEGKRYLDIPQEDILHIRGNFPSALGGASTLSAAAGTFRSALSSDEAAQNSFEQGMRPSGVMSFPRPLDKKQRKDVKEILRDEYVGAKNDGRPLVLDNGVTWSQLSITPKDAQMLESRRFSIEEIARIFGVPPFMIGHSEKSTSWGKGLEQQVLAFLKFTLRRRIKRIEKALEKQLLTAAERSRGMYIKFNMEGLLRADSVARAQFYETMGRNGFFTVNYVREKEGLPPVDGGDVPRVQMQNIPLAEADGSIGANNDDT